jgi:hypothetical protein
MICIFQMENQTLRIRLVSFKDSTKQTLDSTLFYIKKLTQLPSNNGKIESILDIENKFFDFRWSNDT